MKEQGARSKQLSLPSKFKPTDSAWNYRLKFDSSLGLEEAWVDSQTLDFINSFRENIFVSQNFPITASLEPAKPAAVPES